MTCSTAEPTTTKRKKATMTGPAPVPSSRRAARVGGTAPRLCTLLAKALLRALVARE